jgi:hypothetical protein
MRRNKKGQIRNEFFREEIGIQIVLTELEVQQLPWYGHVERWDRTGILRKGMRIEL